jgi:hypothetical protein
MSKFAEQPDKYAQQAERHPGFAGYERMTSRTIPLVALTPTPVPSSSVRVTVAAAVSAKKGSNSR